MRRKSEKSLAEQLIKPRKALSSKMMKSQDHEQENDSNEQQEISKGKDLSPKGILFQVLKAVYGIPDDQDQFNDMMLRLNMSLSLLSSAGADSQMYGNDFDSFYQIFVQTLNVCGYLKKVIDDNGIPVDIRKFLRDSNECDDQDKHE